MPNGRSGRRGVLVGTTAMALGLTVQTVVHRLAGDAALAPLALAQAVITAIPGPLAGPLITLLGHLATSLLVGACAALFLAAGAAAGLDPRRAAPLLVLPWAIGPLAVVLPATGASAIPSAASAVLAASAAWTLFDGATAVATPSASRRRLVIGAASVVAALALGATWSAKTGRAGGRAIAGGPLTLARAATLAAAPDVPDDPPAVAAAAIDPDVTPNPDFYVVKEAIVDPTVDPDRWRLVVGGAVRGEVALGYDDLLDLPAVEQYQTLECIGNPVGGPLLSNALWTGVPLAALLERAGVRDGVVKVIFRAVDGYSSAIPLEAALDPGTLVAFGMNGARLPREHGFPARLLIPGRYGMKNVKWLERVEATRDDYLGFWESKGWDDDAIVYTTSRIDVPASLADLRSGRPTAIAGFAYAGARGVSRVEVSLDGGSTWREATLGRRYSRITWRRWALAWTPAKGFYQLRVRAYDDRGVLQPTDEQDPLPLGGTGVHGYQVEVR